MRLRTPGLVVIVALAGCDAVFGLTPLTPPPPDAPTDAVDPLKVVGRYHVQHTINQADFTPALVDDAFPSSQMTAICVLDDGSMPAVAYHDDGTFSFPLAAAGQSYRLTFDTPLGATEYQSASNHLELVNRFPGRLFPTPVTLPTSIHVNLGPAPGTIYMTSTGVWTDTYSGYSDTATFDFDWQTANPPSWRGLLRADLYDRLYVVDHANYGTAAMAYSAISGYGAYSITQTDGTAATISTPPVATLMHDRCTHLLALRGELFNRLQAAQPGFGTPADVWAILAVPALELDNNGGLAVAVGGETTPTPTDLDVSVTYVDPFVGTRVVAAIDVNIRRNIQLPGTASPYTVYGGGRTLQKIPTTTCTTRVIVQSTVGIAALPTLAGTQLDTDNKSITLAASDPVVTWTLAVDGPVDYATVLVFEVVNNAGATDLLLQRRVVTAERSAVFARSLFVSGHTYLIMIQDTLGAPNAAAGDFYTASYPHAGMQTVSYTFKVN
jgi:hypothetical protein